MDQRFHSATIREEDREVRARLAAILDSSEDAIIGKTLDGIITAWNKAAERIYGYSAAEAIGRPITLLVPPERRDEVSDILERVKHGERLGAFETVRTRKNGTRVEVRVSVSPVIDEEGRIIGASSIARDVTGDGKVARKRQAGKVHYSTLVEWAPDAIIVHRDGRFLYANCPALGICGAATRAQLQGYNFFHMVHPEDRNAVNLHFEQIHGSKNAMLHEFRLVRTDGRVITVEAAGIRIDYGSAPAYLIILRDVSERQRLERERLQAMEELCMQERLLIQQGRFAAMGEMIGNIAHQWRQPLNKLGLIIQELLVYHKLGKFNEQYLKESVDMAMKAILHMSRTIDIFSNFLKPDREKVRFRVGDVVHQTVSMVEAPFHEVGLRVRVTVDQEVSIEGYPNEYGQALLNILMNARDALIESKTEHPLIVLRLSTEGGRSVLTVTDNAGGIPDGIIGKVFDPYFTTKGPDRGTGIGLFLSKTIIEKNMGGFLSVRNVTGGAQFRIEV